MRTFRILARARLAVVFLAAYLAAACTTWQPQVVTPASVISEQHPDRVRLTVADGSQVILEDPSLRTDSIVGEQANGVPSAVALTDVSQLEVREKDTNGTILAIVVGGALVVAASLACFGFASPCGGGS